MRVLLDECVPAALADLLIDHAVVSAAAAGLAGISNGELLRRAVEGGFEAFDTLDKGIPFQQPIERFPLRFILIRAGDDSLEVLCSLAPSVLAALDLCEVGQVAEVRP